MLGRMPPSVLSRGLTPLWSGGRPGQASYGVYGEVGEPTGREVRDPDFACKVVGSIPGEVSKFMG